jgi:tetratricopeptide (TPR) repeat protein
MRFRRIVLFLLACVTVVASPTLAQSQDTSTACISAGARERTAICPASIGGAPSAHAPTIAPSHLTATRPVDTESTTAATAPGIDVEVFSNLLNTGGAERTVDLLEREIATTQRILERTRPDDPRGAEYMMRLAETQFELQAHWATAAGTLDQPLFEARREQAERASELERQQREAQRHVTEAREALIRTYVQLVETHPDYARMDEVLFSLAFALDEMGQFERARQFYMRLIQQHPGSRFVPHAWLSFAEHYFAEGDMPAAQQLYARVLEIPEDANPVYGYALYKQAWVFYNLEDFRGALEQFVAVLDFTTAHPDSRDAMSIARQARRELVLPYSRVGRPAQALALFRRYAENDAQAYEMLESLAELYHDTGQWPETIQVYHRLMSEQPDSDRLCDWQSRVAGATVSSRPKADQVVEATRLVDVMTARAAAAHSAESLVECRQLTATLLVELATAWHREAIGTDGQPGTNDRATMALAEQLYRLAIGTFPDMEQMQFPEIDRRDWPTLYRVSYFHAELLWRMERWSECGPAFDRVVDLQPGGELTPDAAYAAVLCYNDVYQQGYAATERDRRATLAPTAERRRRAPAPTAEPTTPPAARDLTPLEASMARAFQRFVCYVRDSDELPTIRYRLARIHYDAHRYEEAAVLFQGVAVDYPAHELGEIAANLYLDSLAAIRERDGRVSCEDEIGDRIEPLSELYCASPEARDMHAVLCPVVDEVRCGLLRLTAERRHANERYRDAATRYVAIARDHAECGRRDEMLWNAAIDYEAARLLGRAIQARQALIRGFPGSELARRAVYLVGANYHALAIYAEAATWYERFARESPEADEASCTPTARTSGTCAVAYVALENAVFFRLGLGETDRAIEDATLYERSYRRTRPRETSQVVFSLGSVYERTGDTLQMAQHYQRFLRDYERVALPHEVIRAHVQLGLAEIALGRADRAAPHFTAAARAWEHGAREAILAATASETERALWVARAADAASEALFHLAEDRFEGFRAIRFPRMTGSRSQAAVRRWSTEELGPWLQRKFAALRAAEAAYDLVAPLGIPEWEIASAARVGEMYRAIVDDVRSAPIPADIEGDDELYAIYTDALERVLDGSTPGADGQWETTDDVRCTAASTEDTCVHAPVRQATERFAFCLTLSTRMRWFDAFSSQCESELNAIDRARYPLAAELRGTGSFVEDQLAPPGAIDLDTSDEPAPGDGAPDLAAPTTHDEGDAA